MYIHVDPSHCEKPFDFSCIVNESMQFSIVWFKATTLLNLDQFFTFDNLRLTKVQFARNKREKGHEKRIFFLFYSTYDALEYGLLLLAYPSTVLTPTFYGYPSTYQEMERLLLQEKEEKKKREKEEKREKKRKERGGLYTLCPCRLIELH